MSDAVLAHTTLVVTGATGFLGSAFVRRAVSDGADVTLVVRPASDEWRLDGCGTRCTIVRSALRQLASVSLPPGRGRTLVHFAAAGVNQTFDDVEEMVATNVQGTGSALRFALRNGVDRFILIGSSGEYGPGEHLSEDSPLRPTSEYGATRAAATLLARAFGDRRGLDVVVLRPFAVYGPYEAPFRLIPYAIVAGLHGDPIRITSGIQTRDYVHVDDVADGIARACTAAAAAGQVFNLCSGVQTSVRDAATLVAELTGRGSSVAAGARPDIPGEMWRTAGDPSRARSTLGWQPRRSLRDGLEHTIDWFRRTGLTLPAYRRTAT